MSNRVPKHETWLEGVRDDWRKIDDLYAKIVTATAHGDGSERRKLRRRLFYSLQAALAKSPYKGRLLGALGDSTLRSGERLKTLLRSYSVSKKEGDLYNCLLVADSLADFFVEWKRNDAKARFWIAQAQRLKKRFRDVGTRKSLRRLSQIVEKRIGQAKRKPVLERKRKRVTY